MEPDQNPDIVLHQKKIACLSMLIIVVGFCIYGKSLNYSFVYDDYSKYVFNPALSSFKTAMKSFGNPSAQALGDGLASDTYRPLFVLHQFFDRSLWANHVAPLRAQNIFLHGVNSAGIMIIAWILFDVPLVFGALGALFFLVHPTQVESVVWITERSNLVAHSIILLSVFSWILYRQRHDRGFAIFAFVLFVVGLFYRETASTLPLLFLVIDLIRIEKDKLHPAALVGPFIVGLTFLLLYLVLRQHVLQRIAQNPLWGNSIWIHAIYVLSSFGTYIRSLFWPSPLTIQHVAFDLRNPQPLPIINAALVLLCTLALLFIAGEKTKNVFALLLWVLIAWLPTSNLIPLRVLFADRFIYSLLVPFSILVGMMAWQSFQLSKKMGWLAILAVLSLISINTVRTLNYLPVWKNDRNLWIHAISVNPRDSMAWAKIADFEFSLHREYYGDKKIIYFAEDAFKNALKIGLPTGWAGYSFLRLAEINLMNGKLERADNEAARALALRPDFENRWKNMRANYQNLQSQHDDKSKNRINVPS